MFKKNRFLISQIIVFLFFPNLTLYASNKEYLNCQGIYWSNKEAQFAEWKIIKGVSAYKIYLKINDLEKIAKVLFRKGNAGIVIGTGGWENKIAEKSSLTFTYSLTNKIFKMKSRYSKTKIEGKCIGKINL